MAMQFSNVIYSGSLSGVATSQVVDARGYKNALLQVFSPVGGPTGTAALRGTSVQKSFISPDGVAGEMEPAALQNIANATFIVGSWATATGLGSVIVVPICFDFLRVSFIQTGGISANIIAVLTLQD